MEMPTKEELDEQDRVERLAILDTIADELLQKSLDISTSPSRTSIISYWTAEDNLKATFCAYCGKELTGHFEGGVFTQVCSCKDAQKEHESLLERRKLEEQSKEIERKLLKMDLELLSKVRKAAVPHIKTIRKNNNEIVEEALENYIKKN